MAAPNFDDSEHGEHCAILYNTINGLKSKEAELKKQGKTLSDSEKLTLQKAINDYMLDCYDRYGSPVKENLQRSYF